MVKLPDLAGNTREQAQQILRDMGWNGRLVTGNLLDTANPADHATIAGHRPGPNAEVRKDGDITVDLWRNPVVEGVQGLLQ